MLDRIVYFERCGVEGATSVSVRATSAPMEGPAYGLDFAGRCGFPLRAPRRRSGTFTEVARLVQPEQVEEELTIRKNM